LCTVARALTITPTLSFPGKNVRKDFWQKAIKRPLQIKQSPHLHTSQQMISPNGIQYFTRLQNTGHTNTNNPHCIVVDIPLLWYNPLLW